MKLTLVVLAFLILAPLSLRLQHLDWPDYECHEGHIQDVCESFANFLGPDATSDNRKELFQKFDVVRNKFISEGEAINGVKFINDKLQNAQPAARKAFHLARSKYPSKFGARGDQNVEPKEFRFFLQSLLKEYEFWDAFKQVDQSGDDKVSLIEFVDLKDEIEKWIGQFDPEDEFKRIDTNEGGSILFNEWAIWAHNKNLTQ